MLWLAGCATPQLQALLEREGIPPRAELDSVPFFAQDEYQCGPAALAMVLGAGGKAIRPEALRPQVYLPERHGSLQAEMLAAARRNGFVAVELVPDLSDLLAEIAAGNPVIVLQNLAFDWHPVWHYAVAIGYDLDTLHIMLRSGSARRVEMQFDTFERTWKRSGHWAMLALPAQRLPATLAPVDYVNAVVKLERAGQLWAAHTAYENALARWPDNLVALLGLGNTAYALGDFDAAESAFRQAILAHPVSSAAHNNLAQTLFELERYDEALVEARAAVSLGGPLEDISRRTLDTITARTGRAGQE